MAFIELPPPPASVARYPLNQLRALLDMADLAEFLPYAADSTGPLALIPELADGGAGLQGPFRAFPDLGDGANGPQKWHKVLVDALAFLRRTRAGLPAAADWGKLATSDFAEYDSLVSLTLPGLTPEASAQHIVMRVWLRRVALAVYSDLYEPLNWSLAALPDWQLAVLLRLNAQLVNLDNKNNASTALSLAYTPFDNGQNLYKDAAGLHMLWIWDPNPLDFYEEARAIVKKFKPTTPADACHALVWWMRLNGFAHSYFEAYVQREPMKSTAPHPSGWGGHLDCSAKQVIQFKLGGCPVNSRYTQHCLRSLNLCATTFFATPIPLTGQPSSAGAARYFTMTQAGHTAVRCYTANLEMIHGDDALAMSGFHNGWYLSPNKSVWLPADALWYLRQAVVEADDNGEFRKQLAASLDKVVASGVLPAFPAQMWREAVKSPQANWAPAPNLAEQLLGVLSSPPALYTPMVPGAYVDHWAVPPAPSPFAPTAGQPHLRLPQSLARTYSIATCALPLILKEMGLPPKLAPLGSSWAWHVLDAAWKVAQGGPDVGVQQQRLATLARMFFMLDDRSTYAPDLVAAPAPKDFQQPAVTGIMTSIDAVPVFALVFPGERKLAKQGSAPGPPADALMRALFPTLDATAIAPFADAWKARATFDQTQPDADAVLAIIEVATHALFWWVFVRDPDYLPGTPMPKDFNAFA